MKHVYVAVSLLCMLLCPCCVYLQFPVPESHILKSSRIGKAVMLLYKHPRETRKNKEKAGKIISEYEVVLSAIVCIGPDADTHTVQHTTIAFVCERSIKCVCASKSICSKGHSCVCAYMCVHMLSVCLALLTDLHR